MDMLENGIVLPDAWPPHAEDYEQDPIPPPYLKDPPQVLPIDLGRQLFVDDFLVDRTTLERHFHRPDYFTENPVLVPDKPWEVTSHSYGRSPGPSPFAMPFSGGVWYDPDHELYRMWYYGGSGPSPSGDYAATCHAVSGDGMDWEKPDLGIKPWLDIEGTNIVHLGARDSSTVWLDPEAPAPGVRFTMSLYEGGRTRIYRSADGLRWKKVSDGIKTGDRTTIFYNPFRGRWVLSIRGSGPLGRGKGRVRSYWEGEDLLCAGDRSWGCEPGEGEVVLWTGADSADPGREEFPGIDPQLYNLDAVAYESLLLGLFSIWRGDYRFDAHTARARELGERGRPKTNEVFVGFSRDGFHWYRPDRRPFLPLSEEQGDWNWGNVQSVGGCCLVVEDRLLFYAGGRAGKGLGGSGCHDAGGCTGLAFLRRDGFASMDAGREPGQLLTRPVRFTGRHLYVNLEAPDGELRVEVLDENRKPIPPYTADRCLPVGVDSTRHRVTWKGARDLGAVIERPVRFRFHLRDGRLYAFWVSDDPDGASGGYVAAGGPGFEAARDI